MGSSELVIGIVLSFSATTVANFGMNLQKYSFFVQEKNPEAAGATKQQQRTWTLGFLFFVVGQIGILASLGFVDQATAAIFSNVALISNAGFARYFFGEVLTKRDLVAMTLILGGSFLVVIYFVHVEQDFNADNLKEFLVEPLFLVFMAIQIAALVFCAYVVRLKWAERKERPSATGLLFATMAALVGCCSLTFGKMFIQMLKYSIAGDNQFGDLVVWVVTLIFITCALSNVFLINLGLANSPAMVMIPIYYVMNTLLATAGVYFTIYDDMYTLLATAVMLLPSVHPLPLPLSLPLPFSFSIACHSPHTTVLHLPCSRYSLLPRLRHVQGGRA
jgi:drug/metabolite transporter (DMT)-like permease